MPEIDSKAAAAQSGKDSVAPTGDRDRVAMLTLNSDGTVRDCNPVIIDPDRAVAAHKRQFAEKAVSDGESAAYAEKAVKDRERAADSDPEFQKRLKAHQDAEAAGEKAAEAAVKRLSK